MKGPLIVLTLVAASAALDAQAQSTTLASTLDVYAFPSDGQDSSQQSKDEAACYEWAVGNTGNDPFELTKQAQAEDAQSDAEMAAAKETGQGSGARGAVRGAAAGALIGEIANDDASEGAAWGAAAGVIHGRRKGREANAEAQAAAADSAAERAELTATELENFKKAFSVCLEAKNYLVKY
jgi:hypothetical protein